MKGLKLSLVIMAAALLTIGLGGVAYAMHDGGVAHCNACHTMHNSSGGAVMTKAGGVSGGTVGTTNAYLLIGATQSDTCLSCHVSNGTSPSSFHVATYPIVTPLVQLSPGGDFSWLQKGSSQSFKDKHGHNIIAPVYGFTSESTSTGLTAPGGGTGGYQKSKLHCSSCHDPHGKYRITDVTNAYNGQAVTGAPISGSGSTPKSIVAIPAGTAVGTYRLLAGLNYQPKSYPDIPFINKAPVALAPNTYNRTESATDTRVAYGKGMSEWCANCHGDFHNDTYPSPLRHPSGNAAKLTSVEVTNYNAYVKTGNLKGDISTAYTSLVPFEEGIDNLTTLSPDAVSDGSKKQGPTTSNNVMCLTCHRAHASGFSNMTRWDISQTFLVDPTGTLYTTSGGNSTDDVKKAMYDRDPATFFVPFQRSLCNKCHVKD